MKTQLNETKRMQQLAGVINESQLNEDEGIHSDIEQDLINGEWESTEDQIAYLQDIINFCQQKIAEIGHSDSHALQSMHSSGSIKSISGPSLNACTGQTTAQEVYLQSWHSPVTTYAIHFFLVINFLTFLISNLI